MKALGPDGIVVNIARGSIVDQEALVDLLGSGELGGAGLDVFEQEPAVPDALRAIPHAVLTPYRRRHPRGPRGDAEPRRRQHRGVLAGTPS